MVEKRCYRLWKNYHQMTHVVIMVLAHTTHLVLKMVFVSETTLARILLIVEMSLVFNIVD